MFHNTCFHGQLAVRATTIVLVDLVNKIATTKFIYKIHKFTHHSNGTSHKALFEFE